MILIISLYALFSGYACIMSVIDGTITYRPDVRYIYFLFPIYYIGFYTLGFLFKKRNE